MAAVVIAFEAYKPNPQRPWLNHELAELYRAVDILTRAGMSIVTDMGMSDEGDPWFAFCRPDNGDVIVHCARINGLFVATSIAIEQVFRGANFREVIESIVRHEPLRVPLTNASNKLYLHPIMVLAAFVATALLCSKKADAHDLHAAVVSLTPHDAPASAKGLAALKATLGNFLSSISSSVAETTRQALAQNEAEPLIPLAALAAAAVGVISSAIDTGLIDQSFLTIAGVPATATVVSAPSSAMLSAFQPILDSLVAGSGGALAAPSDPQAPPAAVKVADTLDHAGPAATLLTAPIQPQAPAADAMTAHDDAAATASALAAHNFVPAMAPHEAALASSTTTAAAAPSSSSVSQAPGVALETSYQVYDGYQLTSEALQVFVLDPKAGHHGSVSPGATISGAPAPNAGTIAGSAAGAPSSSAADGVAASPTQAGAPTIIKDPEAIVSALVDFATSGQHVVAGDLHPTAVLNEILNTYTTANPGPLKLVIFDSQALLYQVFSFMPGVLFVDEHEFAAGQNFTASAGDPITVDTASGGTVTVLGVISVDHVLGHVATV